MHVRGTTYFYKLHQVVKGLPGCGRDLVRLANTPSSFISSLFSYNVDCPIPRFCELHPELLTYIMNSGLTAEMYWPFIYSRGTIHCG